MKIDSLTTRPEAPNPSGDSVVDLPRVEQIASTPSLRSLIHRLIDVASRGLPAMFDSGRRSFVHSLHRSDDAPPRAAGESVRYGAMVALGARWLEESQQREIFGGESVGEFMERVVAGSGDVHDLGDLAAIAWAAGSVGCSGTAPVVKRLSEMVESRESIPTVELAWCLSALVAARSEIEPEYGAERVSERLVSAFSHQAGVFPHIVGPGAGFLRGHVSCFADQVYPIQALSRHYASFAAPEALSAATRCAEQICDAQGPDGQWWWHYDSRNGRVLEGYPVYSVHQDAMGPMALFDLQEAGGPDFSEPIRLGLEWMAEAPEVGHSLIDDDIPLIWRKVGRAEPGKLARAIRAGASRVHEALRLRALDTLLPATRIDYESRPYHLGWVLDTWLPR